MQTTTTEASSVVLVLARHHRAVQDACNALLACTYCDDPRELVALSRRFEHAALDHLAMEETDLLPAYSVQSPSDAAAILDDHLAIRRLLSKIGLEVELHTVRAGTVERMIATLREHAAREDAGLYAWADRHLPPELRQRLLDKLAGSSRQID